MIKSNTYFGVTAFALAIVGAFASNGSAKVVSILGYTGVSCTHSKFTMCTRVRQSSTSHMCRIFVDGLVGAQTLYTRFTNSDNSFTCSNVLWKIDD